MFFKGVNYILQILGCGDFKQLPPVPNLRYDDDGKYSFESAKFNLVFPHHINLNEVNLYLCFITSSQNFLDLYTKLEAVVIKVGGLVHLKSFLSVLSVFVDFPFPDTPWIHIGRL